MYLTDRYCHRYHPVSEENSWNPESGRYQVPDRYCAGLKHYGKLSVPSMLADFKWVFSVTVVDVPPTKKNSSTYNLIQRLWLLGTSWNTRI